VLLLHFEQLKKDLAYPATEDARKQIMTDIDGLIADARRRSALQFDHRPQGPVLRIQVREPVPQRTSGITPSRSPVSR